MNEISTKSQLVAGAPSRSRWLDWSAVVLACAAGPLVLYLILQRTVFHELLGAAYLGVTRTDTMLMAATALSTTYLALLPVLAGAGIALLLGRPRTAYGITLAGLVTSHTLAVQDALLYRAFGLHLANLVAFAQLPRRWEVAGSVVQWAWLVLLTGLSVALVSALLVFGTRWLARATLRKASVALAAFVGAIAGLLFVLGSFVPHQLGGFWRTGALRERYYGVLAFDARFETGSADPTAVEDAGVRVLGHGLLAHYERAFPLLHSPKPVDTGVAVPRDGANVIVIVLESFRHDALSPELMPKLSAWAQSGIHARRHHAGSIYSEAGLFSLLYGRSPLVFHATLDGGIKPVLCELLARSGYETAYFSGHPKKWMRRELYINPDTFERFAHDDNGGWNDWDRRALSGMVESANATRDRPLFALVFLMSSHFEYQYPPAYERHKPVDRNAKWLATSVAIKGPEARLPILNRYRNTMAFLDDEVSRAIEALDPTRNIVIVTGDHGESIHDDGRYGHGYAFSDIVARVPFAMVGPGIEPREIESLTLHADVVPTVLQALSAERTLEHGHGQTMLEPLPHDRATLLAHSAPNRDKATAVLLSGPHRVAVTLGLHEPTLVLSGFEDDRGYLLPEQHVDRSTAMRLVRDFGAELDLARK